jgi:hypothetical protein
MKITKEHVQLFEAVGRESFINTPANMEFSDGTPATDRDFRAIITLRAALTVLQTIGLVDKTITLDLREPFQS